METTLRKLLTVFYLRFWIRKQSILDFAFDFEEHLLEQNVWPFYLKTVWYQNHERNRKVF